MKKFLIRLTVEEDGQDLIEYALLAGFIALSSTAMITSIGTGVNTVYTAVNTEVAAACKCSESGTRAVSSEGLPGDGPCVRASGHTRLSCYTASPPPSSGQTRRQFLRRPESQSTGRFHVCALDGHDRLAPTAPTRRTTDPVVSRRRPMERASGPVHAPRLTGC